MSDAATPTADWLAAQQTMLKSFFPWAMGKTDDAKAHGNPLEQQFTELRDTWQASVAKWTEFAKDAATGEVPTTDKLREMFTPASWTGPGAGVMDDALQRVLEGPRYAMLWDHDRQLLELQRLTLERDKAVAVYQAIVQKAWNQAFERFSKAVAEEPDARRTWRSMTDRWLAVANDTLIEFHRTDELVEAQRRMLRAASDRHLQERRMAEAWCQAAHVPTRTEVDELQRLVVELRREVRSLRQAATSTRAPSSRAVAPADPAAKPAAAARKRRPATRSTT